MKITLNFERIKHKMDTSNLTSKELDLIIKGIGYSIKFISYQMKNEQDKLQKEELLNNEQIESLNFKVKVMSDILTGLNQYMKKIIKGFPLEDERKQLEDVINKFIRRQGIKELSLDQLKDIKNIISQKEE